MIKPVLVLSLLFALPAASGKVKAPTAEELQTMRSTVSSLEDLLAEHQERLRIHKAELDALRTRVAALESKVEAEGK